jgi:hypothetical protein
LEATNERSKVKFLEEPLLCSDATTEAESLRRKATRQCKELIKQAV